MKGPEYPLPRYGTALLGLLAGLLLEWVEAAVSANRMRFLEKNSRGVLLSAFYMVGFLFFPEIF